MTEGRTESSKLWVGKNLSISVSVASCLLPWAGHLTSCYPACTQRGQSQSHGHRSWWVSAH